MIPDYKCRSRQKQNKRKLVADNNPSQRAFFPRGVRAGELNMHTNTRYREYVKREIKYPHIDSAWYPFIPIGYIPWPF